MRVAVIIGLLILPLSWKSWLGNPLNLFWQPVCNTRPHGGVLPEEFRWQGRIMPDSVIEIRSLNGNIYAEPSIGHDVAVAAVKHGNPDLQREIAIQVAKREDGISISAIYRKTDEYSAAQDPSGRVDVGVDFNVRVPWGVRLIARTVNGDIVTSSLGGPVEAEAVNGNVRLSTSAYGQARVVNGSINASLGSTGWKKPIAFESVHGNVALNLPAGTTSAISARSWRGQVSSEFPSKAKCPPGGLELKVRTTEGNIRIQHTSQYLAVLEDLGWVLGRETGSERSESKPKELRAGACGLRIGGTGGVALAP